MRQRGGIEIIVMLLVILAAFVLVGGSFNFKNSTSQNGTAANIKDIVPSPGYKNLQIRDLQGANPPTPAVTPLPTSKACSHDSGIPVEPNCSCNEFLIECNMGQCVKYLDTRRVPGGANCKDVLQPYNYGPGIHNFGDFACTQYAPKKSGVFCLYKPVIYLYPNVDTFVDVKLNIPGEITESIPLYPDGGWKNVLAHPNGSLEYQGKTYNELYYESNVDKVNPPKKGIVIEKNKLEEELKTITNKLGLINNEQQEFMDFWVPKLKQMNYPYFLVSVIEPKEKERIDGLIINPIPNTRIEFLAYFKGLDKKIEVEPLILPENPPQRVGFTAVEWGGTIDMGN